MLLTFKDAGVSKLLGCFRPTGKVAVGVRICTQTDIEHQAAENSLLQSLPKQLRQTDGMNNSDNRCADWKAPFTNRGLFLGKCLQWPLESAVK